MVKYIDNILKYNLAAALLLFAFYGISDSLWSGCQILLGALWSSANFLFIKHLTVAYFLGKTKRYIAMIKFPLLYGLGYYLLSISDFPPWNLMLGFSLIFLVIIVYSLGVLRTACLLPFASASSLHASLDAEVPELPNFISLLHKTFSDSAFFNFLYYWETLVYSLMVACAISLLFYLGARKSTLIPSRFQNFLEWIVETLRKFVLDILGPEGEKYVPFLGTLFLYILLMNWLVLIPLLKAPTSNFNITVALAICVFVLVQYLNIRNYGILGFLYHMAGSPKGVMGWALVPLMFPIELLTQFTRPVTLALRLFGNVVGEDILIAAFAMFGVNMLAPYFPSIGVPLQIPFMFLALLTGLMQAMVFTLLATIYILLSVPGYEDKH